MGHSRLIRKILCAHRSISKHICAVIEQESSQFVWFAACLLRISTSWYVLPSVNIQVFYLICVLSAIPLEPCMWLLQESQLFGAQLFNCPLPEKTKLQIKCLSLIPMFCVFLLFAALQVFLLQSVVCLAHWAAIPAAFHFWNTLLLRVCSWPLFSISAILYFCVLAAGFQYFAARLAISSGGVTYSQLCTACVFRFHFYCNDKCICLNLLVAFVIQWDLLWCQTAFKGGWLQLLVLSEMKRFLPIMIAAVFIFYSS